LPLVIIIVVFKLFRTQIKLAPMTSGNNKIDKRRASLAPLITYTPWRRGASVARFGGFECFSNAFGWCDSLNGKVFPWWVVGL